MSFYIELLSLLEQYDNLARQEQSSSNDLTIVFHNLSLKLNEDDFVKVEERPIIEDGTLTTLSKTVDEPHYNLITKIKLVYDEIISLNRE